MKVKSYKHGGKYCHNFTYKMLTSSRVLNTDDIPQDSFNRCLSDVTAIAHEYLGLDHKHISQIETVSYSGEDNSERIKIVMRLTNKENLTIKPVIALANIPTWDVEDKFGVYISEDLQNRLNEAVRAFFAECVKYINGEREQLELPETGIPEDTDTDTQDDLFPEKE